MKNNQPKKPSNKIVSLKTAALKKLDAVVLPKSRQNIFSSRRVKSLIRRMLAYNVDQLKEVFIDPVSTVLEKIIANALKRDMEKGEMAQLDKLLNRLCSLEKIQETKTGDSFTKIEITYITKAIPESQSNEIQG